MTPQIDNKIWSYVLRTGSKDLEMSNKSVEQIHSTLKKIEKNSNKTKNDINNELAFIKNTIVQKMRFKGHKIVDLEEDI